MIYDGICISYKNKNSNIRCTRNMKNGSLCCGYHKACKNLFLDILKYNFSNNDLERLQTIKQNIKLYKLHKFIRDNYYNYLDNKYSEYLINGELSWCEIESKYRFFINHELWDIRFLINHFSTQLNNSMSSEPSPKLPNNPFNRILYNYEILKKLKNRIHILNIEIPIQLDELFKLNKNDYYNLIKKEDYKYELINRFMKNLRYQIINEKDSQNNYIGIWIKKNTCFSNFEHLYNEWKDISPYIASINNIMIPNPEKIFFEEILNSIE